MKLDDLFEKVEEFQERYGASETYERVRLYILSRLKCFVQYLPDAGKNALTVAEAFSNSHASPAELKRVRVECWEYLDARNAGTDISKPEYCVVRALICALHESAPDDDLAEVIIWFESLLQSVSVDESCILSNARKYFDK